MLIWDFNSFNYTDPTKKEIKIHFFLHLFTNQQKIKIKIINIIKQ